VTYYYIEIGLQGSYKS